MISKELKELLKIQKKKAERQIELQNKIYQQILTKVNTYAKQSLTHCIYTIPNIIYGFPPFDRDEIQNFIIKKLTDDGFRASVILNGNIHISWAIKDVSLVQTTNR